MTERVAPSVGGQMTTTQFLLTAIIAIQIAAPIETSAQEKSMGEQTMPRPVQLPVEGELPSLGSAPGGSTLSL
jgi:hypothetical protein